MAREPETAHMPTLSYAVNMRRYRPIRGYHPLTHPLTHPPIARNKERMCVREVLALIRRVLWRGVAACSQAVQPSSAQYWCSKCGRCHEAWTRTMIMKRRMVTPVAVA